jgi:putative ABC transport system ATP-binding protein
LNRAGKTIVLITHDSNVAASANRMIKIMDGRVTEEPKGASHL